MATYEELRKLNVNEHVERKNNLTYLSWAWAVDTLLINDPDASWEYLEPKAWGETWMVFCKVTMFGKARTAQLPVMDYKNKAVANPDAFAVNTAMQRCLAKAISLHGIGLYIYAGEDVPPDAGEVVAQEIVQADVKPNAGAWEALPVDVRTFLVDLSVETRTLMIKGDFQGAAEHINEHGLDNDQKQGLWTLFDSKERNALKKAFEEIRKAQ